MVAAGRDADQFQGNFVAGTGHAKAGLVQGGDVYAVTEASDGADFLECRAFVDVVCGEDGLGGFDGNRVRIGAVGGEAEGKLAVHIRSDRLHGGQHRGGCVRGGGGLQRLIGGDIGRRQGDESAVGVLFGRGLGFKIVRHQAGEGGIGVALLASHGVLLGGGNAEDRLFGEDTGAFGGLFGFGRRRRGGFGGIHRGQFEGHCLFSPAQAIEGRGAGRFPRLVYLSAGESGFFRVI